MQRYVRYYNWMQNENTGKEYAENTVGRTDKETLLFLGGRHRDTTKRLQMLTMPSSYISRP